MAKNMERLSRPNKAEFYVSSKESDERTKCTSEIPPKVQGLGPLK